MKIVKTAIRVASSDNTKELDIRVILTFQDVESDVKLRQTT